MIGIVMAGGKGTRMNLPGEKLLLKYKKPLILHVVDSLINSNCFSKILVITSSNSPQTKKLLKKQKIESFDTPGIGYVEDLNLVLKTINDDILVTSGDLPLLDAQIIKKIVTHYNSQKTWTSILVTKNFLNCLKIESNYSVNVANQLCCFTGISLINSNKISSLVNLDENYIVIDDKRIALNLNTKQDYDLLSTT